jgi:thiol-disulfide isomerase/thioredoxin
VLGTLAVLQLTAVAVCNRIDERRRTSLLPVRVERRSDPAHDIVVETLGGGRQILRASGQFQLIHFWATWCPPCRTELPAILHLARRNHGRLHVWAVSTDREWSSVERFIGGPVPSMLVRDPTGEAARIYGVTDLPDSYLIDPQGRVRARFSGAQDWSSPEMDRILRELMLRT